VIGGRIRRSSVQRRRCVDTDRKRLSEEAEGRSGSKCTSPAIEPGSWEYSYDMMIWPM